MDPESFLSRFDDDDNLPRSVQCCIDVFMFIICIAMATLFGYILFVDPYLSFGSIKFSMEPVAYAGLGPDGATAPPAFNVTLHATSTFGRRFCSTGGGTLQAAFSGLTVAVGQVAPFCVDPKASAVIDGAASSAWMALAGAFRERIDRGQQEGGVELEIDLGFRNEIKGPMWVRCRTMLDANHKAHCTTFILSLF
nr:unnamed protein product [Digitaria exilis]